MDHRWIGLDDIGDNINLYRFKEFKYLNLDLYNLTPKDKIAKGAVIDVETNGTDFRVHKVIELGFVTFLFNKETGHILKIVDEYNMLQDPKEPLTNVIKRVTKIKDEDLVGKVLDLQLAREQLGDVELLIAHNASFDRPFVEKILPLTRNKKWGCSLDLIPWQDEENYDFPKRSLDNLGIYHGFFFDAHRAINDCKALLHLISHKQPKKYIEDDEVKFKDAEHNYLKAIIDNTEKNIYLIIARKTPFEKKSFFNEKEFKFSGNPLKAWYKYLDTENEVNQMIFELEELVYSKSFFNAEYFEINAFKRFKSLDSLMRVDPEIGKLDSHKFTKPYVLFVSNVDKGKGEMIKYRGYTWSQKYNAFYVYADEQQLEDEKKWLRNNIYKGQFQGKIHTNNSYKKNEEIKE